MSKPSIEEILVIRPNLRPRIYAYSIADQAHRASVHKRPEQAPPAVANQPTPGWLQPTDGGARLAPGARGARMRPGARGRTDANAQPRWQVGQKKLARCCWRIRRIGVPHTRQGSPARP